MLEPRRIAARAAAEYVARERGGARRRRGRLSGRFERAAAPATRLWFVTEGVLGRDLVRDPFLEDVGVVVLDEFHERHLQGDVALAVVRELQETVRPDLQAGRDVGDARRPTRSRAYLGDAPVLDLGRAAPIPVHDRRTPTAGDDRPLAERVVAAVRRARALARRPRRRARLPARRRRDPPRRRGARAARGGARPRRAAAARRPAARRAGPRAARGPRRRVVLATNVAETSLTVEGVTAVIDSGLARSRASTRATASTRSPGADQPRLGRPARRPRRPHRAGPLPPALAARPSDAGRREHETPEILRLDLSAHDARAARLGRARPAALAWLDAPPAGAVARARAPARRARRGRRRRRDSPTSAAHARHCRSPAPRAHAGRGRGRWRAGAPGALARGARGERDILLDGARVRRRGARRSRRARRTCCCAPSCSRRPRAPASRRRLRARSASTPRAVRAVERARRQLARARGAAAARDAPADIGCALRPRRLSRPRRAAAARRASRAR